MKTNFKFSGLIIQFLKHPFLQELLAYLLEIFQHQVLQRIIGTKTNKFFKLLNLLKLYHYILPFLIQGVVIKRLFLGLQLTLPNIDNEVFYELGIHEHFDDSFLHKVKSMDIVICIFFIDSTMVKYTK